VPWPLATAVAGLAGVLQAAALAPVPHAGWQLLAMALFLAVLPAPHEARATRRTAGLAWLFGTGWLVATFWWLFISMHRYGQLPAPLAGAAVLALAAALALYTVAAAVVWQRCRGGHPVADAASWAALWLLAELARAQWLTGFPWGAIGYAHVDAPLAVLAPWLGVYGVGAMAAVMAALLASVLRRLRDRAWTRRAAVGTLAIVGLAAAVALGPALRGPDFTQPTGTLSVELLQGNVAQDEKFDWEHLPEALAWHLQALADSRADLVVAPETAIPLLPAQLPEGLWAGLTARFTAGRSHALIGVPMGDAREGYTNSVVGLAPGPQPAPYRYDKHHLVPFGEFIPTGFRWFVDLMQIPLGDFNRGPLLAPAFEVRGERVAPNICYEDLFGEDLAARFADPARAPTVLANVSNIGWFGPTVAVDQHLQISRMRTLELQRPMLRATNTGATVVIDARGVVTHALPPHQRGALTGSVHGRVGNTPFASMAAHAGLWPLWIGALAGVGLALRARRGRPSES
jgi:apolipoprotein N-acyltransferase